MTTSRLETFADGVFAIAATLLILDVHAGEGPLGDGLLHAWPSYTAYAVSFLTIGIIWVNHHTVLGQIAIVDRKFLFLNVLFLILVAFIPFPTRLAAEHLRTDGVEAAALAYGITLSATAAVYNLVWLYASRHRRLLREDADPHVISGITRSFLPGPVIYVAATLLALWSATTSLIVFAGIAVFYVLERALFARDAQAAPD